MHHRAEHLHNELPAPAFTAVCEGKVPCTETEPCANGRNALGLHTGDCLKSLRELCPVAVGSAGFDRKDHELGWMWSGPQSLRLPATSLKRDRQRPTEQSGAYHQL